MSPDTIFTVQNNAARYVERTEPTLEFQLPLAQVTTAEDWQAFRSQIMWAMRSAYLAGAAETARLLATEGDTP